MIDILLILTSMIMFYFGYFVIKNSDSFFKDTISYDSNIQTICIGMQSVYDIEQIQNIIDQGYIKYPFIDIKVKCDTPNNLFNKLYNGDVDIVICTKSELLNKKDKFAFKEIGGIYLVWNKDICSKNRDRVLSLFDIGGLNSDKRIL